VTQVDSAKYKKGICIQACFSLAYEPEDKLPKRGACVSFFFAGIFVLKQVAYVCCACYHLFAQQESHTNAVTYEWVHVFTNYLTAEQLPGMC